MHIIENYFDVCGFDHRLVQGGTSVYLWNLSRALVERGHRVSVVTPAHGRLADIAQYHQVETLSYQDSYTLRVPVDPRVWSGFDSPIEIPLRTAAHRITIDNVDIYFLSNDLLDALPDTFYPPYHSKGRDPVFFKPLAFQVDSVRFLRRQFADERAIVHLHEPYYHYLVPAALRDDPTKLVVSTVQSNMPITKMVYQPEVESLLDFLGAAAHVPAADPVHAEADQVAYQAMSQYQQLTHLHYEYPSDHVNIFGLVADHADLVGFLSPGHRDFTATFTDTPFEQLFNQLPVARTVIANAHKRFVSGCALSDSWLAGDPGTVDRDEVLGSLGLDPALTTFLHNARYAVHHKGQVELIRAVDRVLADGLAANFIIRCLSGTGIDDPYFHEVAQRYPDKIHLEWVAVPEERLFAYAASSDFCVFASKFEMDTFLIAQGEAMACGAVPIASAQLGMSHFGHVTDPVNGPERETATGYAVRRSFAEQDAGLVDDLVDRMWRAVALKRDEPQEYQRLSANSVATARAFTWSRCVDEHLAAFTPLWEGTTATLCDQDALRHGWFELLSPQFWQHHRADIARRAAALGDIDIYYAATTTITATAAQTLFDTAYQRADFAGCEHIADLAPPGTHLPDLAAVRQRCQLTSPSSDSDSDSDPDWTVRYHLPHAERVDLVTASAPHGGRGTATVQPLTRTGDHFLGSFTGEPPTTLTLLLTLRSGRVTWDIISHG